MENNFLFSGYLVIAWIVGTLFFLIIYKKFKPTDFIASYTSVAALVLAVAGVALSISEGRERRNHDRLSIKPVMQTAFYHYSKTDSIAKSGAGFKLLSTGLGPGIVKWLIVKVDGKPQPHWRAVSEAIGLPEPENYTFKIPNPGSILAANATSDLFWVNIGANFAPLIKAQYNNRIFMEICYCSFYDECWLNTSTTAEPIPSECSKPTIQIRSNPN